MIWRRRWAVVVVPVIVTGTTAGLSPLQPRAYQSRVEVLVSPISLALSGSQSVPPVNMATESRLVSSQGVAAAAGAKLEVQPNLDELLGGLAVNPEVDTEVLTVQYTAADPREAQRRAQAFADAYLDVRRKLALDDLAASARALRGQIVALQGQIQGIEVQIATTPGATQQQGLRRAERSLVEELSGLRGRLVALTPPEPAALAVGRILLPADLPAASVTPTLAGNCLMAVLVGLLLATGAAFLRERLDDRVWEREPVEAELGVPLLAALPGGRGVRRRPRDGSRLAALDSGSPAAEGYRKLRAALAPATGGAGTTTLMVVSTEAEEGTTAVTANLAAAFALAGKRVTAVSADSDRPQLRELLTRRTGAVSRRRVLKGSGIRVRGDAAASLPKGGSPAAGVQATGSGGIEVVEAGPLAGSPSQSNGSEAMERLLESRRGRADLVLVDAPPVLGASDGLGLAPMVDGLLLVATAGRTRRRALAEARLELERVRANVVGCILNNFEAGRSRPGW